MMTPPPSKSLADRVVPLSAGAHVVFAAFLDRIPTLALADGTLVFVENGKERRVVAHPEATILVAASEGPRLVTGGDDGRVVATSADGELQQIADEKGQWIDALAVRTDGAMAWSAGKGVRARDPKGAIRTFTAPSSVRGLAFAPKGYRLAIAHYGGVSLWFPNLATPPERLEWAGSHLQVTLSPDGRFAITAMQENALHGWRIADKTNMRMTGYPAKTHSLSWSGDGKWLATSGAQACILWPFRSKDGPIGQGPGQCGERPSRVSCVAFDPRSPVVAVGYEDGGLMLCRLRDSAELLVRATRPGESAAISALAWSADGNRLLYGAEDGAAGLVDLA